LKGDKRNKFSPFLDWGRLCSSVAELPSSNGLMCKDDKDIVICIINFHRRDLNNGPLGRY
jgi:hypothetical protein